MGENHKNIVILPCYLGLNKEKDYQSKDYETVLINDKSAYSFILAVWFNYCL